jgi:inhibitor of KinA sporulation pathway (predicted exonuclease)
MRQMTAINEEHHHRGLDDGRNMVRLLPFIDFAREEGLLTPPNIAHLKGCVALNRLES